MPEKKFDFQNLDFSKSEDKVERNDSSTWDNVVDEFRGEIKNNKHINKAVDVSGLVMPEKEKERYEAITPTGVVIAYLRALTTNIPYAAEISHLVNAEKTYHEFGGNDKEIEFSLYMEARWKAIQYIARELGNFQTLEIGSALSPRGLIMTGDSAQQYIETDLPNSTEIKKELVHNIIKEDRSNLLIESLDATNSDDFRKIEEEMGGER